MSKHQNEQKQRKSTPIQGTVVSMKMSKSRVARIDRLVKEGRVGKYMRKQTKIMFHDENNQSQLGDKVLIEPCRPISARKRFKLTKVVS